MGVIQMEIAHHQYSLRATTVTARKDLLGFVKVLAGISHAGSNAQTLAKRTGGHVHKVEFLKPTQQQ